jgi:RHS repeat-associated protein
MTKPFKFSSNLMVFVCCVLFLLPPVVAFGQITNVTDDQSTPTPGAGHNYLGMVNETVNPANGSVSFRLAVPVPKGRGVTPPLTIAYDSNGTFHAVAASMGSATWTSNNGFGNYGWSNTLPMLTWSYITANKDVSGTVYYCDYVTDFVFQDPNGGRHFLGMSANIDTYGQCTPYFSLNTQFFGGDDFYSAIATQSTAGLVMVYSPLDGSAYSFTVSPSAGSAIADWMEDRNGNRVTYNLDSYYNTITVSDTLGRTAATLSAVSSSLSTVSVSGLANPYQITRGNQYFYMPSPGQTFMQQQSGQYCQTGPIPALNGYEDVPTSITLPNGQSYQFTYDSTYGLLTQITYPTGGWVKYTWGVNSRADLIILPDTLNDPAACQWTYDVPAVTERQVSFDGSTVALTQTFSYSTNFYPSVGQPYKTTTVTTTDNLRNSTTVTDYNYNPVTTPSGPNDNTYYAGEVPVEGRVQYYDGSSNLQRTVNKTWSDASLMTCESVTQGGITMRTDYSPGAGVPLSNKKEWDWGQAPACGTAASGTPRRETQISYQSFNINAYDSSYWSPTWVTPAFGRPSSVTTYYNGAQAAQTNYTYDGAGLQSSSVAGTGHDNTRYGTSFAARGNATTKSQWLNTGGSLPWNYTYDDAGQQRSVQDPNGNSTTYSYVDDDAYLAGITYPSTNGHAHTLSFTYNSADGQLASSTDQNSQTTTYFYGENGDLLDRLTGINHPDCTVCSSTVHSVSTTYNDSAPSPSVTTSTLLQSGQSSTSEAIMDGVGHTIQTQLQTDPGGTDYAATTYDGLGRVWTVSNPYRSTSDSTYGLTTTTYDPLGRTISVAHPEGSTTSTSYSASGNTYCSTVSDPASKQRTLCSDALGRLLNVTEAGLNYSTSYTYNGLDDLLTVTQGGQTRTFSYDSAKRLLSAANPESGTTTYTYDGDSNVLTRQDARSITTTYSYDALNRLTSKSYSDGTPTATLSYDETTVTLGSWTSPTLANHIGRLTHTTTSGSTLQTATVQDYDPMGRPQHYWQCTPLNCGSSSIWTAAYTYDFAGDVTSWNHPAGFTITQTINGAKEISQVTSSLSDATHPASLATVTYTPFGSVSALQNGCVGSGCTPLQETYLYNKLLEMGVEELGTSSNHSADSCRVYNYYVGVNNASSCSESPSAWPQGSNNNADVAGYYYVDNANTSLSHAATYSYDAVNRLGSAAATGNVTYSQAFTYTGDGSTGQFGNMSCAPAGPGCVAFTYSASTNRITTSGYSYDAAGNVTGDGTRTYQWDAESRLTVAYVSGIAVQTNTYNALGQRVRDVTQSVTTDEAYGAGGNLLWRYTGNSSTNRSFVPFSGGILAEYWSGGTLFDHPDEIGSTTISSDYTGNNLAERLFYPYGEPWTGIDLNNFNMHQTFAQLPDYDAETDQYNTLNRHYSPSGRWMSPDPGGMNVIHLDAPQTWNLYAYVANNPTTTADPSGLDPAPPPVDQDALKKCDPDTECNIVEDKLKGNNAQAEWHTWDDRVGQQVVVQGTTTTTSTDADGNTTTTVTSTTARYSTVEGHEGEFNGATQSVTTSVTSTQGKLLSESGTGPMRVAQGSAARSLGSDAINSTIAQTVPGGARLFARTLGQDVHDHPGKYAAAAVEVGIAATPFGVLEVPKVAIEVWWGLMHVLHEVSSAP